MLLLNIFKMWTVNMKIAALLYRSFVRIVILGYESAIEAYCNLSSKSSNINNIKKLPFQKQSMIFNVVK